MDISMKISSVIPSEDADGAWRRRRTKAVRRGQTRGGMKNGAAEVNRTLDPVLTKDVLYH